MAGEKMRDTDPLRLRPRHRALMRELIAGATVQEAAERLGMTPQRVSQLKRSELFMSEMERLQDELNDRFLDAEAEKQSLSYHRMRLHEEIGNNIDTLVEIRDDKVSGAGERRRSAMDLLSMTPMGHAEEESAQTVAVQVNVDLRSAIRDRIESREMEGVQQSQLP